MSLPRVFTLLALTLTFACGTDVTSFPGTGGGSPDGGGGAGATGGTGGSGASGGDGGHGGSDPCDCDVDAYVPMCGEDGVTYDAACGQECVPVDIACEGECPCSNPACGELEQDYAAALAKAKQCSPMLPVEQCLIEANDALACPCPTFIDDGAGELAALQAQWDALGCGALVDCPEIACPAPSGAVCSPNANGNGTCSDLFASP